MVLISVTLIKGRTAEQKLAMLREMAAATSIALRVPLDMVRIAIDELPPEHFAAGGVVKTGPSSRQAAA